jgi:hypothetical protein
LPRTATLYKSPVSVVAAIAAWNALTTPRHPVNGLLQARQRRRPSGCPAAGLSGRCGSQPIPFGKIKFIPPNGFVVPVRRRLIVERLSAACWRT